jgi:dolichyl-phosphate-mannose-protein mannosyltransferase
MIAVYWEKTLCPAIVSTTSEYGHMAAAALSGFGHVTIMLHDLTRPSLKTPTACPVPWLCSLSMPTASMAYLRKKDAAEPAVPSSPTKLGRAATSSIPAPLDMKLRKRAAESKDTLDTPDILQTLTPVQEANVSPRTPLIRKPLPVASEDSEAAPKAKPSASFGARVARIFLSYRMVIVAFAALSMLTRFYKISEGAFVLWDEAHFGKFGTHYIDGTFYFDVHPPLGKMLVGLAGKLSGYNGGFKFESATPYPEDLPYVKMRMIIATFGAMCVPFSYVLARNLGLSEPVSLLVGATALLEVGLIGITRLILLDSMLLFFGMAAVTFYSAFRLQRPFSLRWHWNLMLTGAAIGCVSSVKWVGFFTMALVGCLTVEELWRMFGDWKMPKRTFVSHFVFRAVYLIALPVAIYLICFVAHFRLLFRSGPGNANMNSLFQAGLEGTDLGKSPIDVAYGSRVTLRSALYAAGLLHSHPHYSPNGSKQQHITTYLHSDDNNNWLIHRSYEASSQGLPTEPFYQLDDYTLHMLKSGDEIRLYHEPTGKYLHSHAILAPISPTEYEVSAYGGTSFQDSNDIWIVEVAKDMYKGKSEPGQVHSLYSSLRFRHKATGCYLMKSNNVLPSWGFSQGEVVCRPNLKAGSKQLLSSALLWNVESTMNDHLPAGDSTLYKSSFLDDFVEHNLGMWRTNNALIPDPELELGQLASYPYQWMFLTKGSRMSGWEDERVKFFMLGNPLIWWTSSVAIVALLAVWAAGFLAEKRGVQVLGNEMHWSQFEDRIKISVGAWFFNYFPYFLMGRVTYLHHYYPCLQQAIVAIGIVVETATQYAYPDAVRRRRAQLWICGGLLGVFAVTFWHFSSLCYGIHGKAESFAATHKWLPNWNL